MKIMFINTYYYPDIIGGAEISIKKLAEGLAGIGHDVSVLTTGMEETDEIINNVKIRRIKVNNIHSPIKHSKANKINKIIYRGIDLYNIVNYNKLKKEIRKINPDIVNINNIYGISPIIYKVIEDLKLKLVVTLRDYYMICPKARMLKNNEECIFPGKICKLYRNINKNHFKNVSYFTAPSKFVINEFVKNGLFNIEKAKVIYNAIDLNDDETNSIVREKMKRNRKNLKFLYLGRLETHKGIEILLKSFCTLANDNIELFFAGKGSLENMIEDYSKKDKRIKYLGFLNESKMKEILKDCDVLIAPSLWNEPFGRIIIDAYKYGLPVISSNKGGLGEIVDNYKTGIKIEQVTEDELRRAINYYINNDFSKLIFNCKNKIKQFGLDYQVEQFSKLYETILLS